MTDHPAPNLLWPGDHLAGDLFSDSAFLTAMVAVEDAWLATLVAAGVAPRSADAALTTLVTADDIASLGIDAVGGGNPVIPLVALLRQRSSGETARWLHRGLTSQDVVDTALVLCVRDALVAVGADLTRQLTALRSLAERHGFSPMVGRTLTQHAVPITFGSKLVGWITGVLEAAERVEVIGQWLPMQLGGAAGTLAALVELAGAESAPEIAADFAERLELGAAAPWHTSRPWVTGIGDALVGCTDAWGRIAADVLTGSRPEIGEFAEGSGGGSSTMPHKRNPVLSVLLRRTALTAPALASTLHLAAATMNDERADGAWHAEWDTLRLLARRTVVAGRQAADLLEGLIVDTDRLEANLQAAAGMDAEQRTMADLANHPPNDTYSGLADYLIGELLAQIDDFLQEHTR